eukprot:gene9337-9500_t
MVGFDEDKEGLQAMPHSVLYSSMVWKFTMKRASRELPYHRFRQGDSLLITRWSEGGQQVRKDHLLLTVDKADSDLMQAVLSRAAAAAMVDWRLDQSVRDTTARRQLDAINRLSLLRQPASPFEALLRRCLVGTPNAHYIASMPPLWVRDAAWRADVRQLLGKMTGLNDSQKRAIAQAVVRSLTLWQGPPGTGKTRTLLALVEVLVKTSLLSAERAAAMGPLLACADTNAAVDNLVEGLVGNGLKVVRIGQPAKVREGLRHLTLEALAEATPLGQKAAALRETSKALFERAKLAAEGSLLGWAATSTGSSTALTASSRRGSSRPLQPAPTTAAAGIGLLDSDTLEADARRKWGQAEGLTKEAAQKVLQGAHVVCATCAGAGDPSLANLHFNVVVIDEATQATEPATLVPLTQGAQCAVLAGDPAQLPPTIASREATQRFHLDVTLFERLQQGVGLGPLLLDTQYRMHPAISQFPSRWFYKGALQDGVTAAEKPPAAGLTWPNKESPVMVVALKGLEERAEKSGEKVKGPAAADGRLNESFAAAGLEDASYRNLPEARVALQTLYALMAAGDVTSGAILTPYKGQVRSLEYGLRVLAPWFTGLDISVSSVDGYQGREADVIIFTAVRSNDHGKIGFVADPRRLNVAITRPRRGLVVVCNPHTLVRGSSDWAGFVSCAEEQGWVTGPQELPVAPWQLERLDPFAANGAAGSSGSRQKAQAVLGLLPETLGSV